MVKSDSIKVVSFTLPNWLCNLWKEHMCSLEFELQDIYTKIDLDAKLYNQCKHIGEYQ